MFGGDLSELWKPVFQRVEFVAKILYYRYQDRADRRLSLGDACERIQDPNDGHLGAHSGRGDVVDFNYYTMGTNNTTQYQPGQQGDAIWERTQIYKQAGACDNLKLTSAFDAQRNYDLLVELKEWFPSARFRLGQVALNAICKHVGPIKAAELRPYAIGDEGCRYNHHLHIHADLGE